jgi:hypothetical protein
VSAIDAENIKDMNNDDNPPTTETEGYACERTDLLISPYSNSLTRDFILPYLHTPFIRHDGEYYRGRSSHFWSRVVARCEWRNLQPLLRTESRKTQSISKQQFSARKHLVVQATNTEYGRGHAVYTLAS